MQTKCESGSGGAEAILQRFLWWNFETATRFVDESDIVQIEPLPAPRGCAPDRYVADFHCNGLIYDRSRVRVADRFRVGIAFGPDYIVAPPNIARMFTMLTQNVWHPNIAEAAPVVCLGHITPGTPLVDIFFLLYELISWQKMSTHDPLNPAAAQWARHPANRAMYPVDRRPLKRRAKAGAA